MQMHSIVRRVCGGLFSFHEKKIRSRQTGKMMV